MESNSNMVTIDPVRMNITNRICAGSVSLGSLAFEGGLLLQGQHHGDLEVKNGPLVILEGAIVTGSIVGHEDVYIFGQVGGDKGEELKTKLTAKKTLHISGTGSAYGTLRFSRIATYEGANIRAALETISNV